MVTSKGRFWPGSGASVRLPEQTDPTRGVPRLPSRQPTRGSGRRDGGGTGLLLHPRARGEPPSACGRRSLTGWATAWQWNDDHNTTASDVTDLMMSVAKDVRDGPVTKFILDESPPLKVTLS